ncbi:hypothetical protein AUP68_16519 [Ilyonectria robusta]
MWDVIPRLETFVAIVPTLANELNKVKLRLAHRDLRFANLIVEVSSSKIIGVLDWEFAGIVPFTKWNRGGRPPGQCGVGTREVTADAALQPALQGET